MNLRMHRLAFSTVAVLLLAGMPHSAIAKCYAVTCFDGSVHECGFDCASLLPDTAPGSSYDLPTRGINEQWQQYQRQRQMEEQRHREQLRKEQERMIKELQAAEAARMKQDALRRRQFDQDKERALQLLKGGAGELSPQAGPTDIILKDSPMKDSLTVDLRSAPTSPSQIIDLQPTSPSGDGTEKGLRTGYVPKPLLPSLADYRYGDKSRTAIVLDALEVGRRDFRKSIRHLEDYLATVEPDNGTVQEALSYIQGMAEANELKKRAADAPKHFEPRPSDSDMLLDAVAGAADTPPELPAWKIARAAAITETLDLLAEAQTPWTREDFQRCIKLLETRARENPGQNGYAQAVQFFEGVLVFY